jgi:hypothetical protein
MRASRRLIVVLAAWLLSALLGGWCQAQTQTFPNGLTTAVHPGIMVSQAQLNYISAMVQAHMDPIYSAYVKATNSSSGSLTYQETIAANLAITGGLIVCGSTSNPDYGCSNSDDDGTAAYLQAVLWYVTGNQTYANNAINLMNYYAQNVKGYGNVNGQALSGLGTVSSSNTPLQAAWDSQKWPRAAEIIRWGVPAGPSSATSWNPTYGTAAGQAQAAAFGAWMKNIIEPQLVNGSSSNGNWEISMIEGLIGIGVYNDDATTFNLGVTYWKQRIPAYFYYYTDGSSPVPAPRGTASWYGQTVFDPSMNGIAQESCRDFGHAQYGLSGAFDAAETAHIQGLNPDLYQDLEELTGAAGTDNANQGTFGVNSQNRLTSALEFNSYYLLNNPVPSTLCDDASAYQSVANNTIDLVEYPTNEIGYNEFHNRLGLNLPYTLQYLNQTIRQMANPTEYHIMVYETLTHGGDVSQMQPYMLWTNASSATLQAGTSANYTVTVIPGTATNSTVTLSVVGLPAGATYSFSPSAVTGAGTSTLQISLGSTTAPGSYPLTIIGNNGTATYTNTLRLLINAANATFGLSSSSPVATPVAGDVASFPFTLTPLNNYVGNVTLSVASGLPTGATATFTPASVQLTGTSQTATLNITTLGVTPPGVYTLTISGTDGTLTNTTQVQLNVGSITNACIQQMGYYWVTGAIPQQTGTFTAEWDATPSLGPSQTQTNANVGLSFVNMQSVDGSATYTDLEVAARFNPSGNIDARNGSAFTAVTTIPYAAGSIYHFRAVVNVPTATYSIYVTPPGQSEIAIGTNYAFRTGASAGSPASINFWDATAQVGSLALCNMVIETPNFTLSASPNTRTVNANTSAAYAVTLTPVDGYSGNVALSASGLPAGATASFNPATVTSTAASSTMTIGTTAATAPGTYPVTISGTDGTLTGTAYVVLTINPPCQSPSATGQSVSVGDYSALQITLAGTPGANCSNSDPLTFAVTGGPSHGKLTGNAPSLAYTPTAGYVGSDSFSFTVSDSNATPAASAAATVNIAVSKSTCTAPSATAQAVSLAEDSTLTLTLAGTPGAGCSPADALSSAVTAAPSHGTLSGTAPNLVYTPTRGYVGSDSFSFTVSDSNATTTTSAAAAVAITVTASTCTAPSATPQTVSVTENSVLAVTLAGTLGSGCSATDALTSTVTANPTHGVLTGTAPNLEYTPTQGYVGSDSFSFTVSDSNALTTSSSAANVNITVAAPVAHAPLLTSLGPSIMIASSPASTLTLTASGSGFNSTSTVLWNGTSLPTTYVSSTQLTAAVQTANLTGSTLASITVSNPGTSGGVSAPMTLAVDSSSSIVLAAQTSAFTVTPGQTATTPLVFQNLATGTATAVQCYNLPAGANCSYNQQNQTIVITTGLTTPAGTYQVLVVGSFAAVSEQAQSMHSTPNVAWCGLLGLPLGFVWIGRRRRRWLYSAGAILSLLLIYMTACSSPQSSPSLQTTQAATTLTITVN